jgi:chromatin structure-remodeling complex subunit RSC1/2
MNPQMTPAYPGVQPSAPAYQRQNSYQQPLSTRPYSTTPQTPLSQQPRPYAPQQQLHQPSMAAGHPSYSTPATAAAYPRQPIAAAQPVQHPTYPAGSNHIQREQDVFVLPDHVNASIPEEIRDQFPQDDQGRMLFFTKPPVDTRSVLQGRADGDRNKPLVHSAKFLEVKAELQRRRAESKEEVEMTDVPASQPVARNEQARTDSLPSTENVVPGLVKAVAGWAEKLNDTTKAEYQQSYGENWQERYSADMLRQQERKRKWAEEAEKNAKNMQHFPKRETASFNFSGRNAKYKDDYDPRYGF